MAIDVINHTSAAEKLARAINGDGINAKTALDSVKRSDFADDEAYLAAATKVYLERSTPEYQKAYKALEREHLERLEAERRERDRNRLAEILASVRREGLYSSELDSIGKRAAAEAHSDLAAGRISYTDLGAATAKYAEKFKEQAYSSKAENILMNEQIRAAMRGER